MGGREMTKFPPSSHQIVQIKNFYYDRNHYFIECGGNAANTHKKQVQYFKKIILQVSEKSPLRQKMTEIREKVEHMLISDHPLT